MGGLPDLPGGPIDIGLVTPAPPRSRTGNRVTAIRWARILRALGHRVTIAQAYDGAPHDVLIALHARRSAESVARFRRRRPGRPIVVALTGTDLYGGIRTDPRARRSLALATRLILLQPLGIRELPKAARSKARVVYQSVRVPRGARAASNRGDTRARLRRHSTRGPSRRTFQVCVLGHLRPVKDPLRAARAARLLPAASRVRVVHAGAALDRAMRAAALAEQRANPRYRWLGELPRGRALRLLARSRLLVLSSVMEGGANVLSEAVALSVPVLASKIPGSVGILGPGYPGYYRTGGTRALAALLRRAEEDARFYAALRRWCERLRPLFEPARERESWRRLLRELRVRGRDDHTRPAARAGTAG